MEININCDLGESSKLHSTENDPLLLEIVNSANIACGYHAGDKPTMEKTINISKKISLLSLRLKNLTSGVSSTPGGCPKRFLTFKISLVIS